MTVICKGTMRDEIVVLVDRSSKIWTRSVRGVWNVII
jgi:hypothetical protein